MCIENLDQANPACSAVLLKSMEEPPRNVYFIITCFDSNGIPDTLISRSMTTVVNPPTQKDLDSYFKYRYTDKYNQIKNNRILSIAKGFSDIDYIANMTMDQINYFSEFNSKDFFIGPVSGISWRLTHYEDKSEIPIEYVIRYIMNRNREDKHITTSCIDCLNDLNKKRIAKYLVISKLAFELKYCE